MPDPAKVLRDNLLPEKLAPLIEGETEDEMKASALSVASELGIQAAPSEAVILARKAIKHAERYRALTEGSPRPGHRIPDEPVIQSAAERREALVNLMHPAEDRWEG